MRLQLLWPSFWCRIWLHFWGRVSRAFKNTVFALPAAARGSSSQQRLRVHARRFARWYQFAATVRLDAGRSGLAASAAGERASAAEAADVEPAATSAASSGLTYEQHRTQGVKPRGQPHVPLEELAALRPGRSSPSSFVLQRHAVMVCGRPVVVPIPHTAY